MRPLDVPWRAITGAGGRLARSRLAAAGFLIAGWLLSCGGDDDGGTQPQVTAEDYTNQGWGIFEQGLYGDALLRFEAAIARDADYAPAYTGKGWCELMLAEFATAGSRFSTAIAKGATGADARGGQAAALLAQGGAENLAGAVSAAQAARSATPEFVFAHRSSFDTKDLYLIEAFAHAAQASYSQALAAADSVEASGIVESNSATWTVEGLSYPTFAKAVLAFLAKVSREASG